MSSLSSPATDVGISGDSSRETTKHRQVLGHSSSFPLLPRWEAVSVGISKLSIRLLSHAAAWVIIGHEVTTDVVLLY